MVVSNERYFILDELMQKPCFNKLLHYGIVPMVEVDHKTIYDYYLECLKEITKGKEPTAGNNSLAVEWSCEKYNVSKRCVYAIIKKFKA